MQEPTRKAEVLFNHALDLNGTARSEFLREQCASDDALRQELESLLRAHEEAGDFMDTEVQDTRVIAPPVAGSARVAVPPGDPSVPCIPGYRIEHKIGEGSLGIVYRAHDEKLNRPVALKVLRPQIDEPVGKRLLKEARQAAGLNDPAVVTIFSVLDETNPPAIVMELVEGYPLDRFAAQLNFDQKARLLREVARGLAVAHDRGLVHRDLKPDNVVVGPDMRPRILDFGLAIPLDEAANRIRAFEGTPLYASPEQVRGEALGPASDIFSFGCLMFKVLTGRPPFTGETLQQVLEAIANTSPPMLREVAVGVPEDLQAVCLACLAWAPADRPTASDVVLELGRYLAGEPVRVRPKLYDDVLRRTVSEYSAQAAKWESQSIISTEDRDSLEVVHRRLLADEDHWIIGARRITSPQTLLSGGAWLTFVATALTVWMLRDDLGPLWRWLLPACFTFMLFAAGFVAHRLKETLASAAFLAGATLAIAPCTLAVLSEMRVLTEAQAGVAQLFPGAFSNQQVLAASATALAVSVMALCFLKMTGFAWTTAALATTTYFSGLLLLNWLDQKPEVQALWCLGLVALEMVALLFERSGRVRWTLPFHLVALAALIAGLNVMAWNGPTLRMLGLHTLNWPYLNDDRLQAFSFALNGLLFLALMLVTERSASLDLRRASKLLEVLAIVHTLSALFANALNHRGAPYVRADVWIYIGAALLLVGMGPFRSRWRILVGGLAGCGLGSYLLVDLGLIARQPFIVGLGVFGLVVALGAFVYVRRRQRIR
ncbi:MAG: protein kinase [Verrucomicrobiia bacterium]